MRDFSIWLTFRGFGGGRGAEPPTAGGLTGPGGAGPGRGQWGGALCFFTAGNCSRKCTGASQRCCPQTPSVAPGPHYAHPRQGYEVLLTGQSSLSLQYWKCSLVVLRYCEHGHTSLHYTWDKNVKTILKS